MTAGAVVIGTGAWGAALAQVLALADVPTTLVARRPETAAEIGRTRRCAYLPELDLAPAIAVTADLNPGEADVVILAVPTTAVRSVASAMAQRLSPATVVVTGAKGFELDTWLTMTEVLVEALGPGSRTRVAALSGPNIAPEVARGLPAATVVAAHDAAAAARVQELFADSRLRCYTSADVIGVEYGGGLKNVVAIAAGVCDGIGAGDNGKAAIITRGLAELARLGLRAGAQPLTFAGLTGLGDCIVTCMSPHSRNRRVGEAIGRGETVAEALAAVSTAEGVNACRAALVLAGRLGVEMPIARAVHGVLFDRQPIGEALAQLLSRDSGDELRGLGLDRLDLAPPAPGSSSVG